MKNYLKLLTLITLILVAVTVYAKPVDLKEAYRKVKGLEAYCRLESCEGFLTVKIVVSGKPPYRLVVKYADKILNYSFSQDIYIVEVRHREVGSHTVKVVLSDSANHTVVFKFQLEFAQVNVECEYYYALIPLFFLVTLIPEILAYAPKKTRIKASVNVFTVSSFMLLGYITLPKTIPVDNVLYVYSIVASITVILVALFTNINVFKHTLEYLAITCLLIGMTVYSANPLPLIVAGVGNALWLLCVVLFPSEWRSLERLIKSINVLYALFMITAQLLVNTATEIAAYLTEPSWGMAKALTINITLVANLLMALPVLTPLFTLTKLYATTKHAIEAEKIIDQLSKRRN